MKNPVMSTTTLTAKTADFMEPGRTQQPPVFDDAFFTRLMDLFRWRRDVRRFLPDPVAPALIEELVAMATLAPSVGNSQPWRFVSVESRERRQQVIDDFNACNAEALNTYEGERAARYARLKLSGLKEAPVHLAVFCDMDTLAGDRLGRLTMPETLSYSVVAAIQIIWLAARARGLGLGWVSILHPGVLKKTLDVPSDWQFIAYLCIGYPQEEHEDPELVRQQWQARLKEPSQILRR
ncbi:5,6-dimethylbenzimidazole synthase [Beijerinckia indica]|uniref:Cob(II)yrinic acid a,c-diamide reductase n=1 Tax=Beijerinckia indica subsp. indica (strain ATCC 9039 / DSM 1715 / NCIMB 8712) TaxID=395963 RepID=B2IBV3_BEII9|nr:cob(II)yrinic acid a,c-diamide reductase [Beijerinckia indica subsp. indica ATCC 9039]